MKDARRRPRDVVDKFLPVTNRDTGDLIGYLTDVTVDGGMLESEQPLPEGGLMSLRVELSEPIEGSNNVDVQGRCVWNRKDRNAVFHNVGIQFHEISDDTRRRIAQLAERYRLQTSR